MTEAQIRHLESMVSVIVEKIIFLDLESRKDLDIYLNELNYQTDREKASEITISICELLWPEMIGNIKEMNP